MQNWQTATTLIPRAFISLLLLLTFSSTSPESSGPSFGRDAAFFLPDGTLSKYSIVCNLINLCWAVWRCFLALTAGLTYLYLSRAYKRSGHSASSPTLGDSYTSIATTWPIVSQETESPSPWERNLRDRTIELLLMCSSARRSRTTRDVPARHQSRGVGVNTFEAQGERPSAVVSQGLPESMADTYEGPPSNVSFDVSLPATSASAPQNLETEFGTGEFETRTLSILGGRKKAVSHRFRRSCEHLTPIDSSNLGHTPFERPFSSLGHRTQEANGRALCNRTFSASSLEQSYTVSELDEEELERLEWEKLAPLTPLGSLMQARQELAQQRQERSVRDTSSQSHTDCWSLEEMPMTPLDSRNTVARDLQAIVEESDEEASLRTVNSLGNKPTVSSRQSSPRRTSHH